MEKELKFEVRLTARDLWGFSMYHANHGFQGAFNVIFTLAALFLLIFRWSTLTMSYRGLLAVCILLFAVWQPLILYYKARKQAKAPVVQDLMTLTFREAGLTVEQNGQNVEFTWEQMGRMDRFPNMIVLYMDRVHAYLLPKRVLGDQEEALCEMAREHLKKEQLRKI